MGTKNEPGSYDCYANAAPDEPMFVLLARDPSAPLLVGLWALIREKLGDESEEKVENARDCADQMALWLNERADDKKIAKATKIAEIWAKFNFGSEKS
jgi:hypothetical protein